MVAWTAERVREELRIALRGKTIFPTKSELIRAGRTTLADRVSQYGEYQYWADEFGIPRKRTGGGKKRGWTDERIRAVLAGFLDGRTKWPQRREFRRARLSGMEYAMNRYRGMASWAAESGFDYPPPRRRPSNAKPLKG
jgi:hypothetical protein